LKLFSEISELNVFLDDARSKGQSIGLVPTMGALHEGHMSLVRRSTDMCDISVVSIFVNSTQFGPNEDFNDYPRPIGLDLDKCRQSRVDVVFMPKHETLYPQRSKIDLSVFELGDDLCGLSRPGHFNGVLLIVTKLFNLVHPDYAFFGEKDFQQLTIIKQLVRDLNFSVKVIACPILRLGSGLALSSRNAYLSEQERTNAASIYKGLQLVKSEVAKKNINYDGLRHVFNHHLATCLDEFELIYFSFVNSETLKEPKLISEGLRLLVALKYQNIRLIDNTLI
jgi:pantoate--beta-alanine ligase